MKKLKNTGSAHLWTGPYICVPPPPLQVHLSPLSSTPGTPGGASSAAVGAVVCLLVVGLAAVVLVVVYYKRWAVLKPVLETFFGRT